MVKTVSQLLGGGRKVKIVDREVTEIGEGFFRNRDLFRNSDFKLQVLKNPLVFAILSTYMKLRLWSTFLFGNISEFICH